MPTRLYHYSGERANASDVYDAPGNAGHETRTDQAYTGSRSYRLTAGRAALGHYTSPAVAGYRAGYFLRHAGVNGLGDGHAALAALCEGYNGTTNNNAWLCWRQSDNRFYLRRRIASSPTAHSVVSTDLGAVPADLIQTATWLQIGVWYDIHDTAGRILLWVNGTLALDYTGDTRSTRIDGNSGNYQTIYRSDANGLMIAGATPYNDYGFNSSAYVDDLFFESITHGETPEIPPTRRWIHATGNGDGADAQWTPIGGVNNRQNVDDIPHDNDTTYNKATAADLRDTFNLADPVIPADHLPVAVNAYATAKKLDPAIATTISLHLYDGSQYSDSPDLDLPISYNIPVWHRFTTMPDGSAFDQTKLAAIQAGYRSRGVF